MASPALNAIPPMVLTFFTLVNGEILACFMTTSEPGVPPGFVGNTGKGGRIFAARKPAMWSFTAWPIFFKPFAVFSGLRASLAHTDYEHVEFEGDEVGTRFLNTPRRS